MSEPLFDHMVDDKGNKWILTTIFNSDIQEHITVLQPYQEDTTPVITTATTDPEDTQAGSQNVRKAKGDLDNDIK